MEFRKCIQSCISTARKDLRRSECKIHRNCRILRKNSVTQHVAACSPWAAYYTRLYVIFRNSIFLFLRFILLTWSLIIVGNSVHDYLPYLVRFLLSFGFASDCRNAGSLWKVTLCGAGVKWGPPVLFILGVLRFFIMIWGLVLGIIRK